MKWLYLISSRLSSFWAVALIASVMGSSCGVKFKASLEDLELRNVASGPSDIIPPTVVLTASDSVPVVKAYTVTATFSEAVTGVAAGDFSLTNLTAGTFTAVSSTVYTLVVTPIAVGPVSVAMNAGVAIDGASNPNTAAATLNDTFDPSCTIAYTSTLSNATFAGTFVSTAGVVWNMGGNIYNNVASANHNFGSTALRAYSLYVPNGVNVTALNWNSKEVYSLTFTKGCGLGIINFYAYNNYLTALDLSYLTELQVLQLGSIGNNWTYGTNDIATLNLTNNTKLTSIDLTYNSLVSIDVSNKPFLLSFNAGFMPTLTSINTTNSAALTLINLNGSTNLSTVDITTNTALTDFLCNECNLSTINFINNTALKNVYLAANFLTSINVTMLPALEILMLGYYGNNWSYGTNDIGPTIDLSNNPNLKYIDFTYNNIVTLDLSNKPLLENVYARGVTTLTSINLTNTPALKNVGLAECSNLAALDVTTSPLLETLNCYNCDLTTIDLQTNRAADTHLTTIYLVANRLTGYFDTSNLTALTTLVVGDRSQAWTYGTNDITSVDFTNNVNLTYLDITYNNITSLDVSNKPLLWFVAALPEPLNSINLTNSTALTHLYLSGGTLSTVNTSTNINLTHLYVHEHAVTAFNFTNNTFLDTISIWGNQLTAIDLSNQGLLQTLYLGNQAAGAGPNTNLITALDISNNPLLWTLDVSYNTMTTLDASAHAQLRYIYAPAVPLTTLDVTNCNNLITITNIAGNALTTLTMGNNTALNYVQLQNNPLMNMTNIVNSIYAQRAVMPVATIRLEGSGVPAAPTLVQINDLITTHLWTVPHD